MTPDEKRQERAIAQMNYAQVTFRLHSIRMGYLGDAGPMYKTLLQKRLAMLKTEALLTGELLPIDVPF